MCLGLLKRTSSECVPSGMFCHTRGSGSKTRASSASRRAASVGGVRGRRPWAASSGSVPHRVASAGRGEASLDVVSARVFAHAAIAFANRVASAGRPGAIWAVFWATFWAAGRGTRRSCNAKLSVAEVPRGVFLGRSKKRRSGLALRNMSHPRIGVENTSPFVFGRSTRNRPKSHL